MYRIITAALIMLLLVLTVVPMAAVAAEVKNLKVGQSGDNAVATYDLVGQGGELETEVTVTINIGGKIRTADKLSLTGDLGKGVKVGPGKKIIWQAKSDLPPGFDGELNWDVRAVGTSAAGALRLGDKPELEKTFYAIGIALARQVVVFDLTPAEFVIVQQGFADSAPGKKPEVELETYNAKIQQLAQVRRAAQGEKHAAMGKEFIDKAAKEKGAVKTDSGMVYLSLKEGSGASPAATDKVKVHYRGTLVDGKEFDSSYKRNQPIEFPLTGVIKCWTEGVQKMKVGGTAKLVCPPAIAYGEKGSPPVIPPNATLVFEVELLDVIK
jgi:FKBP-type peptidyl-prolyl cis-trans isomerase FkpA